MKLENRSTHIIRYLSLALVFLLAVGAFVLSYAALWDTALSYGVPSRLAWLWPLLVDGAIVVFSLAVVRNGLLGERTVWSWALVILFTLGTIILNGIHSDGRYVSIAVAIVAPIALVLAFETSMAMLKSDVKRAGLVQSIAQIEAEMVQKQAELTDFEASRLTEIEEEGQRRWDRLNEKVANLELAIETRSTHLAKLQEEVEAKSNALDSYNQDVEAKRRELKELTGGATKIYLPANLTLEQKQDLASQMAGDGLTNEQVATALGVSLATVKNYKRAAKEANGNGPIADPADVPWTAGGKNGHRKG